MVESVSRADQMMEDPRSNNDGRYYGDRYRPDYAQGRYGYDRR